MFKCEGKIAFLTGALGVIGRAYTKALAKNNIKGIALVDIQEANASTQKEIYDKYADVNILNIKADISNKLELKNAFEKTVKHFGQLDIVINNAGIANEDNYEQCINTNFLGTLHGTQMAIQEYLPKYKQSSGIIVNTASIAGVVPFTFPIYCISKHAVVSIGLCYAENEICKKQDIRILTICPGPTPSPVLTYVMDWVSKNTSTEEIPKEKNINDSIGADYLGNGLINIMEEGCNGSVWMFVENKEPFKVDYKPMHKNAMEYLAN